MLSCADVFIGAAVYKNCAVCAVWAVMCAGSSSLAAGVNSRVFWSSNNMLEVEPSSLVFGATQQALKMLLAVMGFQADLNRKALIWISTAETQFIKSKIRVTGLHMEEDFHVCYSTLQKQDVLFQLMSRWQAEQTCFLELPNRSCGKVDSRTELSNAERCTCSQRRRRFKKRNIAEKVNGTCKQDFTCRNGLIAVPTVNKDFSCCETTQQKIQVSGLDRKMCLKKEFHYCDLTLQKQGLSCSEGKEEDFKKKSLLQLRPITRFQLQRCCRDVLTAFDRKEIHQLCLDSSHETYIAVTVPQLVKKRRIQVSNVARARLWTEEDCPQRDWIQNTNFTAGRVFSTTRRVRFTTRRALYCKTSSDSKAPEHATQYKKCQYPNLDVDTE
ncbi:hypothetical protein DPMN_093351 [Dreissena polymorpha]|uniref:Uncharacterized protein n=1 Tax=Dreissena polymorpha TaxID=45954 RepID=A0A9D4R0T5_DREPO|nr:hypothetical protein DPMN_093351 [Dreissena polymorpha]